jgi:hypothetical protein
MLTKLFFFFPVSKLLNLDKIEPLKNNLIRSNLLLLLKKI